MTQVRTMENMTARQRRFVEEYLASGNVAQAAIRAGYSEKAARQAGYKLIRRHAAVQAAIVEAEKAQLEELGVSKARLARRLERIAFADGQELDSLRCTGRDSVAALKLLAEFGGFFEHRLLHRVESLDWTALLADRPQSAGGDE